MTADEAVPKPYTDEGIIVLKPYSDEEEGGIFQTPSKDSKDLFSCG